MARIRKYQMATGICGPTVLYTNIIKAYSPEEAARKYLEEKPEEGNTEEMVREIAKKMYEILPSEPIEVHVDATGKNLTVGDPVYAIVKLDGKNFTIVNGIVSKLTKRRVEVTAEGRSFPIPVDEQFVNGSMQPFFPRIFKITEEMDNTGSIEVGSEVAYMVEKFMSSVKVFAFGVVTKVSRNSVSIKNGSDEVRRAIDRVRRIR